MVVSTEALRSAGDLALAVRTVYERSKPLIWHASNRHGVTPATGTLALVHDLLNTVGTPDGQPDLLADLEVAQSWSNGALQAWASSAGSVLVDFPVLDADGATALRVLRETLEAAISGEGRIGAAFAATVTVRIRDGLAGWLPRGEGVARIESIVLTEMLISQRLDTWRRLRRCHAPSCTVTFYDRTWDQRQIWHDGAHVRSSHHDAPPSTRGPMEEVHGALEPWWARPKGKRAQQPRP